MFDFLIQNVLTAIAMGHSAVLSSYYSLNSINIYAKRLFELWRFCLLFAEAQSVNFCLYFCQRFPTEHKINFLCACSTCGEAFHYLRI